MLTKIILSKKESEKIRNIRFYQVSFLEKNGIPIDKNGKEIIFPTLEELQKIAVEKILQKGFHEVTRVAPNDANCIIRVFNKTHFTYCGNEDEIYNMCGFSCYTKNFNTWVSISNSGRYFELDFSKCLHRLWLYQDEYFDFDCNFFDCYVCIK